MKKGQRKFYLRQQLRAIKKELGEDDASGGADPTNELQARIDAANLPSEAAEVGGLCVKPVCGDGKRDSTPAGH